VAPHETHEGGIGLRPEELVQRVLDLAIDEVGPPQRVDEVVQLADRPAGPRLLADAAAGRFEALWVYRTDRLGRNHADMAATGQRMEQVGVVIWSVTEGRKEGLIFDVTAAIAQNELRTMRRRFADSIDEAAARGEYPRGVVAYGYRVGEVDRRRLIVPDHTIVWGDWTSPT
jgi:site-specific DNA recombinase